MIEEETNENKEIIAIIEKVNAVKLIIV